MAGYGLGVLGLSLVDLEMLTPAEFAATCEAYQEQADDHVRDAWTRTRILAAISVQPHTTRKITPEQLLPLPWDNAPRHRPAADTPKMTTAEQRARAHELAARLAKKQ